MKRIFKKNQIMISALAVMIAVAGYLNYSGRLFGDDAAKADNELANQELLDISLEETRGTIGKYGLMRKEYLRNHKVARFNILTLQNRLDSHLMEIDSQARQRVDNLMSELLEKNPAPDKMADGMAWTRHMNQIKAQAEELVIQEIIYN